MPFLKLYFFLFQFFRCLWSVNYTKFLHKKMTPFSSIIYQELLQGERKNLINCQDLQRRQLGFFIQLVLMEVLSLYHVWFLRSWEERGGNISTPERLRTLPQNLSLVTNFFIETLWYKNFENFPGDLQQVVTKPRVSVCKNIKLNKKDHCCSIIK